MSPLRTKTEKEARYLEINKKFDHGLATKDLSHWDNIIADDAVLHNDGYTLLKDVHGRDEIKKYYQGYIDRYDYDHHSVAGAASDEYDVSFSLHVDKDVHPKDGAYKRQHKKGEVEASNTAGIFHLRYNKEGKIQEIYFLRQLSKDEQHRKLKYLVDYSNLSFDVEEYEGVGYGIEPSKERSDKHRDVAKRYNEIWDSNDVNIVDEIFAEDAHIYNLNSGQEREGRDTFKKIVRGMLQDWDRQESHETIATSAGNKAFIYWSTKGSFKGEESTIFGLTFLVFNKEDRIQELATLMQPFPSQRAATLKEEYESRSGVAETHTREESSQEERSRREDRSRRDDDESRRNDDESRRDNNKSQEGKVLHDERTDIHSAFKGKSEGETACYTEGNDGKVVAERTDYKDVKKAEVYEARPKEVVYEERLKEEVWEKVPTKTIQERVVERLVAPKDSKSEFTVVTKDKEREYTKSTDEEWRQSRIEKASEEETSSEERKEHRRKRTYERRKYTSKTEKRDRYEDVNQTFDQGLVKKDLRQWDDIIADEVVLHGNGWSFDGDVKGYGSVRRFFQSYIDRYDYERNSVAGATYPESGVSFLISVDKNVHVKKGEEEESDVTAIFYFKYNEYGEIKDIWFLHQLPVDQNEKTRRKIDYSRLNQDITSFGKDGNEADDEQESRYRRTAEKYSEIWDGQVDNADVVFADDVQIHNLTSATEWTGKDHFKSKVKGLFKDWERKDSEHVIATTPGNKAFIYWTTRGTYKGETRSFFGLTFLVFNKDARIEHVVTMMEPFPSETKGSRRTKYYTVVSNEDFNREEEEVNTVCYKEIDTGRVISERTEYKDVKKADVYEARPKAIVYEERKKEERWEKVPTRTVQEVVVEREVAPKATSSEYTVRPDTEKEREYSKPANEDWKDTRVEKKHEETNFRSKEVRYEDIKKGRVDASGRVVDEHTEYTERKVGEVIESRPKETIYEERVKEEVWEKVPTRTTQTVEVTRETSSKGEGHQYKKTESGEKVGESHTVRKPAEGEWKETRTEVGLPDKRTASATFRKAEEENSKWETDTKSSDTQEKNQAEQKVGRRTGA